MGWGWGFGFSFPPPPPLSSLLSPPPSSSFPPFPPSLAIFTLSLRWIRYAVKPYTIPPFVFSKSPERVRRDGKKGGRGEGGGGEERIGKKGGGKGGRGGEGRKVVVEVKDFSFSFRKSGLVYGFFKSLEWFFRFLMDTRNYLL